MSERKHTPGPWRAGIEGNNRVYGPDNMGEYSGLVATVIHHRDKPLITAAPDLFEALQPFEEQARLHVAEAPEWSDSSSVKLVVNIRDLRAVLAALAKARGTP